MSDDVLSVPGYLLAARSPLRLSSCLDLHTQRYTAYPLHRTGAFQYIARVNLIQGRRQGTTGHAYRKKVIGSLSHFSGDIHV